MHGGGGNSYHARQFSLEAGGSLRGDGELAKVRAGAGRPEVVGESCVARWAVPLVVVLGRAWSGGMEAPVRSLKATPRFSKGQKKIGPLKRETQFMVGRAGLEPATIRLKVECSTN